MIPLNFLRIFAISLLIRFSSSSRTRAPRMSAMNFTKHEPRTMEKWDAYLREATHTGRHLGRSEARPEATISDDLVTNSE